MENTNTKKISRPVLVCITKGADLPVLKTAISNYGGEALICKDIQDLCSRISDESEAAIIGEEMLSPASIPLISDVLKSQPEWSDLPVLVTGSNGSLPSIIEQAKQELGNVYFTSFTPDVLNATLHNAFRSRDRQRRDSELAEEYKRIMQDLQESRNLLEKTVRDRTSELAESTSQLHRLTGELILSEQKERRRLAGFLHDHLQQLLVSARYRVASLTRTEDPEIKITAQEVEELLGEVIEASRSLTSELSPPVVYESGLRSGMEWLADFMSAKGGLSIQLKMEGEFDRLDENVKVILFESTRELLYNVIRHSSVQSAELLVEQVNGDFLQIAVIDKGVGFDPEKLKDKGVGLLRIGERLNLVGGRLEIRSAPGRGARITIKAPRIQPRAPCPSVPVSAKRGPQSEATISRPGKPVSKMIRVLIADDHAVMRQSLMTQLSQEPDIVTIGEAADGEAALEKARNLHPDVVLMDLGMPQMNGIEATRKIHSEMPDIRIIGLSVYDERERAGEMFTAGAVAYLSKSCSVSTLTSAIRRSAGKS